MFVFKPRYTWSQALVQFFDIVPLFLDVFAERLVIAKVIFLALFGAVPSHWTACTSLQSRLVVLFHFTFHAKIDFFQHCHNFKLENAQGVKQIQAARVSQSASTKWANTFFFENWDFPVATDWSYGKVVKTIDQKRQFL
jgi:hypothetical protein